MEGGVSMSKLQPMRVTPGEMTTAVSRQLNGSDFLALFLLKSRQMDRHSLCHNDGDSIIQHTLSEHKHIEGGADVQGMEDG